MKRKNSQAKWPITAFTQKNDKVDLYENGKWEYAKEITYDSTLETTDKIVGENFNKYIKDKLASLLVKSKKLNVGVYIDPTNGVIPKVE